MSDIEELIHRRRLQVLVHSYIYYELDDNIISDATWSKWAMQLVELQNANSDIADKVIYADVFKGFKGSTGSDLKYDDWVRNKAKQILEIHKQSSKAPSMVKMKLF